MKTTSCCAAVLALALSACLSACAGDSDGSPPGSGFGHGPDHDQGDGPRGPDRRPSLFISPSGEPFRAPPGAPYPVAAWFAQVDRKHDGRIDRAEFRADAAAFFARLDENHDGIVDSFEVQDYERNVAPEILGAYRGGDEQGGRGAGGGDGPGGGGGPSGGPPGGGRHSRRGGGFSGGGSSGATYSKNGEALQGAAPYDLLNTPEPVLTADAQLDGRITLKEFLDNADRDFDLLDTAGRGYLTLDSLPKTPAQQQIAKTREPQNQLPKPAQ